MGSIKGRAKCPAHPYMHRRRRSGRSPALPYPPRRRAKLYHEARQGEQNILTFRKPFRVLFYLRQRMLFRVLFYVRQQVGRVDVMGWATNLHSIPREKIKILGKVGDRELRSWIKKWLKLKNERR